ncbi:MAG: hypothetical protein GW908_11070 [Thiomicrospira sp.]|nr:hypothetical protein [Thiomicrospira sp.]
MTPTFVMERSKATWQSTPTPVIARSKATWQSIFQAVQDESWIASPAARNDGGAACNDPNSSHCEERSDVAIHTPPVIARSEATWQSIFQALQDESWIASPPARNDGRWLAMSEF